MNCLTDIEVQAVVDGEASDASRAHSSECRQCRERVDRRRMDMAALTTLVSGDETMSPELDARMRRAIAGGHAPRGATSLRAPAAGSWHRAGWVSAAAVAAMIAIVVFAVLPRFGSPTSLSASEVLGRSLKTMSGTTGVEMLEYEFFAPGEMPGPHRIEQLIDHDQPGRFRFSNYGPDGVLMSAISQDSTRSHRLHLMRVDGRNYIINLTSTGSAPKLSLPEMGQALVETAITMMQATSDQNLSVVDTPEGRQYIVEMPAVRPTSDTAMFDLYHARAVIDERDFRILEFAASGAFLKQPYSVTFKLIRRSVRPSSDVPAAEFEIPAGVGDLVITGVADIDPVTDVLTTVLRELGRVKGH
jgi:hypothetical protein